MDPTPQPGENGSPAQVSNDTSAAANSATNTGNEELERLRKEKAQAEMRANQLSNELAEKRKAEEDARTAKLEEEGKLRELLEAERAAKQRLLDERDASERRTQLDKSTNEVLSKYSPAVVELARTAGLSLVDDSEEAKTSLIEKLDTFQSKLGGQPRVQGNNPAPGAPLPEDRDVLISKMRDTNLSPRERDAAGRKAIGNLEAIRVMKEANGIPTNQ